MEQVHLETFRGDLDELHRMALSSWRDEYGRDSFPDYYTPEFVRFLTPEGLPPDHLQGAYDGGKLVAFVAHLPRDLVLWGEPRRAVLSALLVCRRDYLRRGLAEGLIRSALTLQPRYRYDLALFYLERGHRSSRLFAKLRAEGRRIETLMTISPLVRVLDLPRVRESENLRWFERAALGALRAGAPPRAPDPPGLRSYRPEDLDACLDLFAEQGRRCDLARRLGPSEAARLLGHPGMVRTLVVERAGRPRGLVSWVEHVHQGRRPERWAWVLHAVTAGLEPRARRGLYAAFLRQAASHGCIGALQWNMRAGPVGSLYGNRFFPYPRRLDVCAWILNPDLPRRRVRSMLEMQV